MPTLREAAQFLRTARRHVVSISRSCPIPDVPARCPFFLHLAAAASEIEAALDHIPLIKVELRNRVETPSAITSSSDPEFPF